MNSSRRLTSAARSLAPAPSAAAGGPPPLLASFAVEEALPRGAARWTHMTRFGSTDRTSGLDLRSASAAALLTVTSDAGTCA